MTAKLIKGTEIREVILDEIQKEVAEIKEKHGVVPGTCHYSGWGKSRFHVLCYAQD